MVLKGKEMVVNPVDQESRKKPDLSGLYNPQELRERQAYYHEVIRNYTMMADPFARNMLKDMACAEYVIQVITGQKDLKVQEVTVQADYQNLQGKSSILDCVARDAENNLYDIEVEQTGAGTEPKRARYYSGLLDMNILKKGEDYTRLRKAYVIFIAQNDELGRGLPIYHIRRVVEETGDPFSDDSYVIYVNAGLQEDTELGRLMHDFHCSDPAEMYSDILRERARALKNTAMEVESMCNELKEIEQYGMEKGVLYTRRQSALQMLADGLPHATIARYTGLTEEEVDQLAEQRPA